METTLDRLEMGSKAEIVKNKAQGQIRRRLIDMGVTRGTHIKVLRSAPLGDPIEIELKGFHLTLRLEEARMIIVKLTGRIGDGKPMGNRTRKRYHGGECENE